MPKLIVLRHAKAIAGLGLADVDRPLADRGRRDAAATGEWLRENGLVPDRVLCSPAVRTRETTQALALSAKVEFESRIYDNCVDTLLALVAETDADIGTLLLVGHNPSVHDLVYELTGGAPEGFPTCALAVIELAAPWPRTMPRTGTLVSYRTPKD
jgi:phosphohistidine phosphatase